ncbi:MAG: hypothetical protein AABX72_03785 [Nanoarchaeota archaeon]
MQQQKEKELQEKQARLTQISQQPQAPVAVSQPTPVQAIPPPQPAVQVVQQSVEQIIPQEQAPQVSQPGTVSEIKEFIQEEPQQEILQVQAVVEPLKVEQQSIPIKKEEPWHPQMIMPPKEAPTVANVLYTSVDMSRIENLTRSIMYRDLQKSGFAKKGVER